MHHLAPRRTRRRRPHPVTTALLAMLLVLVCALIGLLWHGTTAPATPRPCPPPGSAYMAASPSVIHQFARDWER